MRFMVQVEADFEMANKLDAQPNGPATLFKYIAETYKPEAFYVDATRRKGFWVIDFKDNTQMVEFTHTCVWNAGAYPNYTPVLTGQEAATAIPVATQKAKKISQ